MKFTKMHGCGNDYIYVDGNKEPVAHPDQVAKQVSDRHFGIGGDGLVMILPPEDAHHHGKMRMFNADGSEAGMCGNAIRCVGKYLYERGLAPFETLHIETKSGVKVLRLHLVDNQVTSVTVDMGVPVLEAEKIPVIPNEVSQGFSRVQLTPLGFLYAFTCVSMGNPHAVTFTDAITDQQVLGLGPVIERDVAFPEKVNVEFAHVLSRDHIQMRVFERGTGETLACGTGACATVVAACLNGLTDKDTKVTVELLGGQLEIIWDQKTNHVFMTGPATIVFDGDYPLL